MAKTDRQSVTVRFPRALLARVDAFKDSSDEFANRSDAILHLVRRGLSIADERPASAEDVKRLRDDVATMGRRLAEAIQAQPVAVAAALPEPSEEALEAAREDERRRLRELSPWARLMGRF